jgi:hypothetical protein
MRKYKGTGFLKTEQYFVYCFDVFFLHISLFPKKKRDATFSNTLMQQIINRTFGKWGDNIFKSEP